MQAGLSPLTFIYFFYIIFIGRVVDGVGGRNTSIISLDELFSRNASGTWLTYLESWQHSQYASEEWARDMSNADVSRKPDTAVVLLNWSRLSNVVLQTKAYCSPALSDVVERVFIWNNRPGLNLSFEEHFSKTGCRPEKLLIYNSPDNILFQARFFGCIRAGSRLCFLQDDDYVTRPEILRNIHSWFNRPESSLPDNENPTPIILLPPHDHLESVLLDIFVPFNAEDTHSSIMTSFACLGHGTFLLRSQAEDFMALLDQLALPKDERTIADNYFTLLSGRRPNIWLTHTIELGDSETLPFTFGREGDERNWKHINRAMVYLKSLTNSSSQISPFLSPVTADPSMASFQQAPCISDACSISSNITTLPSHITSRETWTPNTRMQTIQAARFSRLGQTAAGWYIDHSLDKAVDGDPQTSFRSVGFAKKGDKITISLYQTGNGVETSLVELVWLVDTNTATILNKATFEISWDDKNLVDISPLDPECFPVTTISLPEDFEEYPPSILASLLMDDSPRTLPENSKLDTIPTSTMVECFVSLEIEAFKLPSKIWLSLNEDIPISWAIYEFWLRKPSE